MLFWVEDGLRAHEILCLDAPSYIVWSGLRLSHKGFLHVFCWVFFFVDIFEVVKSEQNFTGPILSRLW